MEGHRSSSFFSLISNGPGGMFDWILPGPQAYLLKFHWTAAASCHQLIISLTSRAFNNVVLNQHTCRLTRLSSSSHACLLHRTSNNVCYNCTQLTGMLGTVALDKKACLSKLHLASVYVLFYFLPTSSPGIIATGSADLFTHCACLIMWQWTSMHVWN